MVAKWFSPVDDRDPDAIRAAKVRRDLLGINTISMFLAGAGLVALVLALAVVGALVGADLGLERIAASLADARSTPLVQTTLVLTVSAGGCGLALRWHRRRRHG